MQAFGRRVVPFSASIIRRAPPLHRPPAVLQALGRLPTYNSAVVGMAPIRFYSAARPPAPRPAKPVEKRRTKDELLKQANTRWDRFVVHVKWPLIRAYRPFNTDDLSALFSWVLWGHILWIVLGTTTFISLLVWAASKFRAEDILAQWVGRLVTKETGLRVVFEEAIVPDWKQGVILLRKVFVSRRPQVRKHSVVVGSQSQAADEAEAALTGDNSVDDGNYTQFDLTIDHMAVTLSVSRWLQGLGILKTVEVRGVRGVIDRRFIVWDPHYDATEHRNKPKSGDFNWQACKIEDLLVTVLQEGRGPYQIGLYLADLPRLRKQWLFYDFLSANNMTGSFDNSLFTLHPRQTPALRHSPPMRIQRLRMDDVDIRHLNRGVEGMFGWIDSGTVDFLADITLPNDEPELNLREKLQDVIERWQASFHGLWKGGEANDIVTSVDRARAIRGRAKAMVIELRCQFNNTKASAPLYSRDLNTLNNALIHPIVAYINSRDTYIPIHCRLAKRLQDFDGSWTVYDSGLMADLSRELYSAFAHNVADDEARSRRIKKVGVWSLQFLAQLVLLTLGIVA